MNVAANDFISKGIKARKHRTDSRCDSTSVRPLSPGIEVPEAKMISSVVALWAQTTDVPSAMVSLHLGTFAAKVSQAGWRWEALKRWSALSKPDSMIYKPWVVG